ncbi:serine protease 30-like [Palaemon carinicauda]|uniref:serine protease 30-like n=1 Tax=Palaemon carinicauda TaxID=392227 RepID=UPI0035B68174
MKRIFGGDDATEGQYPFLVMILLVKDGNTFVCTGSILSSTWVLTAAHCLCHSDNVITKVTVEYGSVFKSKLKQQQVKRTIVHPGYAKNESPYFVVNDIGLIELCSPLDMSLPGVEPICFARDDLAYAGKVTAIGWGKTQDSSSPEVLQHVTLDTYPVANCKIYHTFFKSDLRDEQNKICTNTFGKYQCQGDSGGPLIAEVAPRCHVQLGITSYGTCSRILPGVSTKISSFADWICQSTLLC